MTLKQTHLASAIIAALLVVIIALLFASKNTSPALASAPTGLPATIATTSALAVTSTQTRIFATSSCSARIISTGVNGIMLTFSDKQGNLPTATTGFWQAASTTIAYDSGQFGCGAVRVYSSVDQTIYVSESN